MVEFKDLALRDVTFALCAKRVSLDEFMILEHKDFEIAGLIRGSVSIIGQSHIFEVSNGEQALAEILLCVPHNLTPYGPICRTASLSNFRLGLEHGGWKYATRISTRFVTAPDGLRQLSDSFSRNSNSLVFHFPQGSMSYAPITSVEWQIYPSAITVQTFHIFPNENALVKTKTRVSWA